MFNIHSNYYLLNTSKIIVLNYFTKMTYSTITFSPINMLTHTFYLEFNFKNKGAVI